MREGQYTCKPGAMIGLEVPLVGSGPAVSARRKQDINLAANLLLLDLSFANVTVPPYQPT
jgi:hypothetical protein